MLAPDVKLLGQHFPKSCNFVLLWGGKAYIKTFGWISEVLELVKLPI